MGRREGKGKGREGKKRIKKGNGGVDNLDIAGPDLQLSLRDATAAASGPIGS